MLRLFSVLYVKANCKSLLSVLHMKQLTYNVAINDVFNTLHEIATNLENFEWRSAGREFKQSVKNKKFSIIQEFFFGMNTT